jgi:multidrug transporter EmrE-like cation transporter
MHDFGDRHRSNTFAAPMRIFLVIFLSFLLNTFARLDVVAQDSLARDASIPRGDSLPAPARADSVKLQDSTAVSRAPVNLDRFRLKVDSTAGFSNGATPAYGAAAATFVKAHPQFRAAEPSLRLRELERKPPGKEWTFYLFAGLLLFLCLVRLAFPKYVNDMFRVFLNTSMRQKQLRDQLIQEPLPSIFLNLIFMVSAATYLYFVLAPTALAAAYPTWTLLGGCMALIASVYIVKFLVLRTLGWIFGKQEAAEGYLFVVFMVNKIGGMVMLPFSILLAYANDETRGTVLTASYVALSVLLLYRLVRGYGIVHKTLRIKQLYFLLFVVAFEVTPILLLYKGLNTLF